MQSHDTACLLIAGMSLTDGEAMTATPETATMDAMGAPPGRHMTGQDDEHGKAARGCKPDGMQSKPIAALQLWEQLLGMQAQQHASIASSAQHHCTCRSRDKQGSQVH